MAREENKYLLSASGRFTTIFTVFLLCGVCAIGAVFVYYTNDVITSIQQNEAKTAGTYTKIWQLVASDSVSGPVTSVLFDEVILKSNFPIVITDSLEHPLFWKALPNIPENVDRPDIRKKVEERLIGMKARKGFIPIYVDSVIICKLFYDDNALIDRLRLIPIVEMGMVLGFIILALVGFQHIRRSEQRSIWVGMAKETAHQLGTPISSLLGWVNLLRTGDATYSPHEIYHRIDIDLARLETIANRFGKIGSLPKMEKADINILTKEVVEYYRERLPHSGQGVRIDFIPGEIPETSVNPELYRWVVENLLKNSLEAVDSKTGIITVHVRLSSSRKQVVVDVTDNGRGIPRGDARRIFRPGFTTKKRGWGLGLSLARRIITEYHKGNIFLAKSEPGKGATFVIHLPLK